MLFRSVLAEDPVARVHAVGAALLDCVENCLGVQVALGRGLAAECVGLVGETNVQRVAVEFRIDRDGLDPHLSGGPNDSDGDLSTVGDEDFLEHE